MARRKMKASNITGEGNKINRSRSNVDLSRVDDKKNKTSDATLDKINNKMKNDCTDSKKEDPTPSIDSRELAALKRLPIKVELLEFHIENLKADHKKELKNMMMRVDSVLRIKEDKIKTLTEELRKLRGTNGNDDGNESNGQKELDLADYELMYDADDEKNVSFLTSVSECSGMEYCDEISAVFSEVSEIGDKLYPSDTKPKWVDGYEWTCMVAMVDGGMEVLVVGKQCPDDECLAVTAVAVAVVSQKSRIFDYGRKIYKTNVVNQAADMIYFNSRNFISLKDLFDEERGYVKDDSFEIRAVPVT